MGDIAGIQETLTLLWLNLHLEENPTKQKFRTKWIGDGDANTRYFRACL